MSRENVDAFQRVIVDQVFRGRDEPGACGRSRSRGAARV